MATGGSVAVKSNSNIPLLNQILSRYALKEEHVLKKCPSAVRLKIAKEIRDWKMVGHYLNLSEGDLKEIEHENCSEAERKVDMLETWHKREGSNATYLKLAKALYRHGRTDLVELYARL